MKRIDIISDTYTYWDGKYEKYFAECGEIWHAGGIGSSEVAQKLAAIKPLGTVCGNCGGGDLRKVYYDKLRFKCEDVDVPLAHISDYPGNYASQIRSLLFASPPQLFVCGHSHILKVQYDKTLDSLHTNPGATGLQGWHRERTLIRLTMEDNKFTDCKVITLNDRNHHP